MLKNVSDMLRRYTNGWLVLLFLAGEVFFNAVIFPSQQARMEAAPGGAGPIDVLFFYRPDEVYPMVASYGEEGRTVYRFFELTGDTLYPIVYTLLFSLLITWLFRRAFAPESSMHRLNVMPLGGWLFDLLENLGIVTMLSVYPSTPPALAWISAFFTLAKWLFAAATLLLILFGMAMALKRGFK